MALCPKTNPEIPQSATLNAFPGVSHLSNNSWPAQPWYEAGSAYRIQPHLRSNAHAVDRSLALKIR